MKTTTHPVTRTLVLLGLSLALAIPAPAAPAKPNSGARICKPLQDPPPTVTGDKE